MGGAAVVSAAVNYGDHPSAPLNSNDLAAAVLQLQNTVNALIALFNTHTHGGVTTGAGTSGAPSAATQVTNTTVNAQTAQNLFSTT